MHIELIGVTMKKILLIALVAGTAAFVAKKKLGKGKAEQSPWTSATDGVSGS
jgi:hypothetical protein